MDPGNNHYFSWLKFQLEKRNLLDTFKGYTNHSNNEERLADVVETSLGALVIATRVPELEAMIQKLLPEGVTPEQVYHSLGASIRYFGGKYHEHKTPRKRSVQPPGDYSRWKVSFRFRYATPLWEHPLLKAEEEPSRTQAKARASPPVPVCTGEEQIKTLQCTGGFGASLLECTCSECMVVKLLLGRTNPR